jgi:hypothetical protein
MSEETRDEEGVAAGAGEEPGPRYTEEDLPPAGAGSWTPSFLIEMRESPIQRRVLLVVALLAGLALAWFHWAGLFFAGALVGLVSKTVPRAACAGFVVGVLVLGAHVLTIPAMGAGEFVALSPPSYLAVAAALLMPLWGSFVRGVV